MLQRLTSVYNGKSVFHRVKSDRMADLLDLFDNVTALIRFPSYVPEEIMRLADDGYKLPTGITRHIIHGRALRVNLPLSVLMVFAAVDCCLRIRRRRLLPDGVGRRLAQLIRQGATGPLETQLRDGTDMVSIAASDAVVRSRGDLDKMEQLFEDSVTEQSGREHRPALLTRLHPSSSVFNGVSHSLHPVDQSIGRDLIGNPQYKL